MIRTACYGLPGANRTNVDHRAYARGCTRRPRRSRRARRSACARQSLDVRRRRPRRHRWATASSRGSTCPGATGAGAAEPSARGVCRSMQPEADLARDSRCRRSTRSARRRGKRSLGEYRVSAPAGSHRSSSRRTADRSPWRRRSFAGRHSRRAGCRCRRTDSRSFSARSPDTGGYAKIATVITADLWRIGQAKPGDSLRSPPWK